jgi:3-methyladenine DNA glycosylase Mpg
MVLLKGLHDDFDISSRRERQPASVIVRAVARKNGTDPDKNRNVAVK